MSDSGAIHKAFPKIPPPAPRRRPPTLGRKPVLRSVPPPTPPLPLPPPPVVMAMPMSMPSYLEPMEAVDTAVHTAQAELPPDHGTAALVDGILLKQSGFDHLIERLRTARGAGRLKLARLVEHLRLLYQLKVMVQVESLKQKRSLNQAQLNKWVVSTYKVLGFTVLSVIVF